MIHLVTNDYEPYKTWRPGAGGEWICPHCESHVPTSFYTYCPWCGHRVITRVTNMPNNNNGRYFDDTYTYHGPNSPIYY